MLKHFKIHISHDQLFTRCLTCNQELIVGNHEDLKGKVPPYILGIHKAFSFCPQCKKFIGRAPVKKDERNNLEGLGKKDPSNDFIDA